MIKRNMYLAVVLVTSILVFLCEKNREKSNLKNEVTEKNMDKIKKNLESGQTGPKENPFSLRILSLPLMLETKHKCFGHGIKWTYKIRFVTYAQLGIIFNLTFLNT